MNRELGLALTRPARQSLRALVLLLKRCHPGRSGGAELMRWENEGGRVAPVSRSPAIEN